MGKLSIVDNSTNLMVSGREVREGVEREHDGGDDDEGDGDDGHDPGTQGGVRLLEEVPQHLLQPADAPLPEDLLLLVLLGLVVPVEQLPLLVVALHAAGLQVQVVDAPVLHVLT